MKRSIQSRLAILSVCLLCSCVADVEPPKPTVLNFGDSRLIIQQDSILIGDTLSAAVILDSTIKKPLHYQWSVFGSLIKTDNPSLRVVATALGTTNVIVNALDSAENIVWSDTASLFVRSLPTLTITPTDQAVIFSQVTISAVLQDAPGKVRYTWKIADLDTTTDVPDILVMFREVGTSQIICQARLVSGNALVAQDTLHLTVSAPSLQISEQQLHGYSKVLLRCYAKFNMKNQSGGDIGNSIINLFEAERNVQGWSDSGSYFTNSYHYSDSAEWRDESVSLITSVDVGGSRIRNASYVKAFKYNWGKGYAEGTDDVLLKTNDLYLISFDSDSAVYARGGAYSFQAMASYYDRPEPSGYSVQGKWIDRIDWYDADYPPACYVIFKK